jgi:hypothetical protein
MDRPHDCLSLARLRGDVRHSALQSLDGSVAAGDDLPCLGQIRLGLDPPTALEASPTEQRGDERDYDRSRGKPAGERRGEQRDHAAPSDGGCCAEHFRREAPIFC